MKIDYFRIKAFLMGALLCAVISACGGSPAPVATKPVSAEPAAPAGADELDAAIREASTYLNGRVPKSSKAVFLNIRSDYPDLSEYLLNVLSENAVNDGAFSVVDRQQLDTIRAELDFQMSGEVSDESAQNIGQMLGAQTIVSGAVSKLGSLYRLQVKAIEVQSAGVQGQWSRNIPNGATIAALTEKFVPAPAAIAVGASSARSGSSGPAAASSASGGTAAAPVPEADAPAKTYKIGDTGPGGGKIFYVSETGFTLTADSSICHYLEAAPVDLGGIRWATSRYNSTKMATEEEAIGTGKRNTDVILDTDISAPAAEACKEYRGGGKSDWFLPSLGELAQLYKNRRQVGGLGTSNYWTSTQDQRPGWPECAWYLNFSNGDQAPQNKSNTFAVRAIRAF